MFFLEYEHNGIHMTFCVTDDGFVRFVGLKDGFSVDTSDFDEREYRWHRLVELQVTGEDQNDHHFSKHTGSSEGFTLKYAGSDEIYCSDDSRLFYIEQRNSRLSVKTYFRFLPGVSAFQTWNEVTNLSDRTLGLDFISSFHFLGADYAKKHGWQDVVNVYIPHNYWFGECCWKRYGVKDLGLYDVFDFSGKRISVSNTGTWSSKEFLPMGILENRDSSDFLLWQIESSGSWNWEVSTMAGHLYLMVNGPTFSENGWQKNLEPGGMFRTVSVGVTIGKELEAVFGNITDYRRGIRREAEDNRRLPVIFNDYMNCLNGDPSTEKELPLIEKAAEVGCEYYCVDAGWYDDGEWWGNVGEWLPAKTRFRDGLAGLLERIRAKGMVPGLWLEIEVMGTSCPMADRLPDSWFFMRNGKRVVDHTRYQLDFRNPEVQNYATGVIARLVEEYGVGYIKMDYNINAGVGTELNADSCGDGLLEHNRAYLAWLDGIFQRYPDLVVENCASGGCRMDYAMLARHSIQSTSDQTDYRKYAVIAANCPSAVAPEQAAVWSYPMEGGDEEETAYNMVNCLLLRIHQSGHLARLSPKRFALVKEAVRLYKTLRNNIPCSHPVWPNGLNQADSPSVVYGLKTNGKIYLAVWNQRGEGEIVVPLNRYLAKSVRVLYPQKLPTDFAFSREDGVLRYRPVQRYCARLFEVKI